MLKYYHPPVASQTTCGGPRRVPICGGVSCCCVGAKVVVHCDICAHGADDPSDGSDQTVGADDPHDLRLLRPA